jgi:hypothetical protein
MNGWERQGDAMPATEERRAEEIGNNNFEN